MKIVWGGIVTIEKRKNTLINILYFSAILLVGYLLLKYVFEWFLPFIIGFVIALGVNALSMKICRNTKINVRVCSIVMILILYVIALALVVLFSTELIERAQDGVSAIPEVYNNVVTPLIDSIKGWSSSVAEKMLPNSNIKSFEILDGIKNSAGDALLSFSGKAALFLAGFIKKIPDFLMLAFFGVVSSVLIVWDFEKIKTFAYNKLPKRAKNTVIKIKNVLFNSVFRLLKAYIVLMFITFIELLIGFFVLKIPQPMAKAFIISFVDFLPLIGLSIVLIPWILLALLQKNFYLAIGLSVLFLIITVIRNFAEPKIVGKQIGLSPIVSLICFYVGLKLFGFLGIIVLPLIVILLKNLKEEGVILV